MQDKHKRCQLGSDTSILVEIMNALNSKDRLQEAGTGLR